MKTLDLNKWKNNGGGCKFMSPKTSKSIFHRMPQIINLIPLTALVIFLFLYEYYRHFVIPMFFYALYELIFGKYIEKFTKNTFSERKLTIPFYYVILLASLFYAVFHYAVGDYKVLDVIILCVYTLNAVILDVKLITLQKRDK
jgi:hypothetical protein